MIDPAELYGLPFAEGLPAPALAALARHAVSRRFEPGRVLWTAGSEPKGLYLVLEGEVRVVRGRGTRQLVVHVEQAGGTLGEIPLFAGGAYPASAVAARPTRCAVLSREALFDVAAAHPEVAFQFLRRLAERVRELVSRLDRLALLDARARVAGFLLERARSDGGPVVLGMTQSALAEELGTVREVVVRALRDLARRRLIAPLGRGRFDLLDPAGLARLAEAPD